jgi:hypothetical protein
VGYSFVDKDVYIYIYILDVIYLIMTCGDSKFACHDATAFLRFFLFREWHS